MAFPSTSLFCGIGKFFNDITFSYDICILIPMKLVHFLPVAFESYDFHFIFSNVVLCSVRQSLLEKSRNSYRYYWWMFFCHTRFTHYLHDTNT